METLIYSINFMETLIDFIPLPTTRNSFFIKRMNSILQRDQIDILFQELFEPHSELKSKNLFLLYNIMPDYFKFLDINIITDENKRYYEKITSLFEYKTTSQENTTQENTTQERTALTSKNNTKKRSRDRTNLSDEIYFGSPNTPTPTPSPTPSQPFVLNPIIQPSTPPSTPLVFIPTIPTIPRENEVWNDLFDCYDILWNIILNNWKLYHLFVDAYMYKNLFIIKTELNGVQSINIQHLLLACSDNISVDLIEYQQNDVALKQIIEIEIEEIINSISSIFIQLQLYYSQLIETNQMKEFIETLNLSNVIKMKPSKYIKYLFESNESNESGLGFTIYKKYQEILQQIQEIQQIE